MPPTAAKGGYASKGGYGAKRRRYSPKSSPAIAYGYPLGRVRVLAGKLLPLHRLQRLVDAADGAERQRVLVELGYGETLAAAHTPEEIEAAADVVLERAYAFLEESNLPEPVRMLFRVNYDFLNLRLLLKARATNAPQPERFSAHGSAEASVFERARDIAGDAWIDALPTTLRGVALDTVRRTDAERKAGASQGALGASVDAIVDKALYERIGYLTAEEGSAWFARLGRVMIDLANLRILVRALRFGKEAVWLSGVVIDGGNVGADVFGGVGASPEVALERVQSAVGSLSATDEQTTAEHLLDPAMMDVAADNVILRVAGEGKTSSGYLEPIVSYVLAVEHEVKLLRMILIARAANVPPRAIQGRLRELYV